MSFDLRIIGDWLHIMSFVSLIIQIKKTRHLKGFAFLFLTLRALFIGFTLFLIYQMKLKKKKTIVFGKNLHFS